MEAAAGHRSTTQRAVTTSLQHRLAQERPHQGLEPTLSRANMATALEEPTMRKTLGLCFLAFTLTAATAHAQGLFLGKGDPGISATLGGAAIGTGWSASVASSYTYRGMFDVGVNLTRYAYNNGDASKL